MKKIKLVLVVIMVIVALAVFFWPKYCGEWREGRVVMATKFPECDCDCIGIKAGNEKNYGDIACYGIPFNHYCSKTSYNLLHTE
ncbi:MAG: hypothetical protein J7L23_01510 [Candidatus Diapherotrites archaeon]|nr:hypothetical protein [Candidatus Diapherotrites archaeon]